MSAAMIEDLKDKRVPPSLYWSIEQVSEWVESLGLGQYKVCVNCNTAKFFIVCIPW